MIQTRRISSNFRYLFVALAALIVAACSSDDPAAQGPSQPDGARRPAFVETPVEDLYNRALDELQSGIYRQAAAMFDEVERQHPYSVWARRAMLMSAYAHYLDESYDLAILSAERFLALHPGNKNAPYANYLVAICYYEQISDVGRDQKMTELALARLIEVARRYPETRYARDARLKIDLTRDHLAGKEMAIGRYYLDRGQYVAAINRFRNVATVYETTTHVPEALHRLVEIYLTIGLASEAQTVAAVLGYNHPGTDWYEDSYALLQDVDLQPQMLNNNWVAQLRANKGSAGQDAASNAGRAALLGSGNPNMDRSQFQQDQDDRVPASAPAGSVSSSPAGMPAGRAGPAPAASTPSGVEQDEGGMMNWLRRQVGIDGGREVAPADESPADPVAITPPDVLRGDINVHDIGTSKDPLLQRAKAREELRRLRREAERTKEREARGKNEEESFWQRLWPF